MSLASTVANGMQMRTTTKGGTLQSRNSGPHADSHPCTAFLNLVAAAKGDAQLPADLGPLMPDCRSPSGRTPVIVAALAGNPTAVERLASAGYSVAEADRHGQTPLSFAARLGDVPTVAALLKHQADPSACDEFGCTPLHKAASWGHAPALKLLLDHNVGAASSRRKPVDPNLRMQPTRCAPETRAVSLFETPLQLAVDAGARGGDLAAVPRSARRASVEVLLARGADPNCADKLGNTVLLSAARAGDWGAVCRLRRAGADAGVTNQEGDTAARLVARPELNLGWRHRAAAAFALHAPTWALAPLEPLCWDRREGNP